jgi:hypothetical protein
MKQLKLFGLAAVAALGLMAMAGAGTASATELCSTNTSPCTGTVYTSGTAVSAQLKAGTTATLTNTISNVICQRSTTTGRTTSTGGKGLAVTGTIESLGFTECRTASGVSCTVRTVHIPYAASITATGSGNGTLTVRTDGTGDPGATVECATVINCTFTTASASLGVTGGNPAIAKANGIALTGNGITCPLESHWDAEYEVTAPRPLFIVNP